MNIRHNNFIAIVLIMVGALGIFFPAAAQTFIEPPAAPPGGNSASWISTDATTERKLGSLRIGTAAAPASICLNAVGALDAAKCVSSWSQVIGLSGGPFVARRTTGISVLNQSRPRTYFSTPPANSGDIGAVAIEATGPSQAISLIAQANSGWSSASYGLFAGDGGSTSNYAAYFKGKVGIEKTAGTNTPGQLCLNGLNPYNGGAAGCITNWGQLVGGLFNYVRLQPVNPPTADAGNAGVADVGNFGTLTVGDAPAGQVALTFCGDAQCSTHIGENTVGNPNYCPIDCVAPLPPVGLSLLSPYPNAIRLTIQGQAQVPVGNYILLVVRSDNPSFTTDTKTQFIPQNGVRYTTGNTINGVKVVAVRTSSGSTRITITDSELAPDVTYFYRLYQANLFPIYNQSPLVLDAATNSSCPQPGPDETPPFEICA